MANKSLQFDIIIDGKKAVAEIKDFTKVVKQTIGKVEDDFKKIDKFPGRFKTGIKSIKQNWLQLTAVTGGMTLALKKSFDEFKIYDKKIREIGTLLDDVSENSIKKMGKEIRQMSIKYGQSIETMAKAKYDVISAGFTSAAESAEVLAVSAKLAVGGIAEISNTALVITKTLSAYSLKAKEAEKVSDILFTTVRLGQTTIPELARSIGDVASIANTAKVPLESLGGAFAVLTKRIDTAKASTALRGAIQQLAAPTEQAARALKDAGIELKRFDDGTLDMVGTLRQFQGLPLDALRKFIPDIEGANAVTIMANNIDELAGAIDEMGEASDATNIAFTKLTDSASFRAAQTKAIITSAMIAVGEAVEPVQRVFADFVKLFSELPAKAQQAALALVGVVGVLRILSTVLAGFAVTIGPAGWLLAGLGLLATALAAISFAAGDATEPLQKFKTDLAGLSTEEAVSQIDNLKKELENLQAQAETQSAGQQVFVGIPTDQITGDMERFAEELPGMLDTAAEAAGISAEKIPEAINPRIDEVQQKIEILQSYIDKIKGITPQTDDIQQTELDAIQKTNDAWKEMLDQRVAATKSGKDAELNAVLEAEHQKIDFLASSGQISLQQYRDVLLQRLEATKELLGIESQEYEQLQNKIGEVNQQISADFEIVKDHLMTVSRSAWDGMLNQITDFETQGGLKWKKLWDGIAKTFIRSQLNMMKALLVSEQTKEAFKKRSTALMLGHYAKEGAGAVASAIKTIGATLAKAGAYIAAAAAKIYQSFASIPFGLGIPVAVAVIAGMVAAFKGLKSTLTAFGTGGRVTSPTMGIIGELGETEVISPEKDALTVMRELAGQVLADVRGVVFGQQAVAVEIAGIGAAGGAEGASLFSEMRDLLEEIRDKEISLKVENRIEGRDIVEVTSLEETFESERTL